MLMCYDVMFNYDMFSNRRDDMKKGGNRNNPPYRFPRLPLLCFSFFNTILVSNANFRFLGFWYPLRRVRASTWEGTMVWCDIIHSEKFTEFSKLSHIPYRRSIMIGLIGPYLLSIFRSNPF